VHHHGSRTEDDDLRNSIEEQYSVPISCRGFLGQHPQMPSDAYLDAPTNVTDQPCWRESDEERPASATSNEQDLYSTTNHTDQPPHNVNVSGWLQQLSTPAADYSDRLRGGSGVVGRTVIEISPRVKVRLRGAEETWDCIGRDFFMPCTCFGFSQELCCIQDATFVLCPACRVVSPMDNTSCCSKETNSPFSSTSTTTGSQHRGGVGLGFTFDDLMKWQVEIIQRRQSRFGNCF
jgi:hypothetical protein